MNLLSALFPKANSDYAFQVDLLYLYLNVVSIFFTVLIAGLVIYFCVKYARRGEDDRPEEIHGNNVLEITWSVIPFLFMLVMFVWGTVLHLKASHAPEDAIEILVTGKQWMWKVQHPNGKREINNLTVPQGVPVKLTITSEDVIHSYYIPVQRVKRDAVPGRYTTMWFQPDDLGVFHIFCAEYCGAEHSMMKGFMHVVPESFYNEVFLGDGHLVPSRDFTGDGDPVVTTNQAPGAASQLTPEQRGEKVFNEIGCMACHPPGAAAAFLPPDQVCPDVRGTYMEEVELIDGTKVVRDDEYLMESIKYSQAKLVKGFLPGRMPPYEQLLTDEQVKDVVAWIKSLEKE